MIQPTFLIHHHFPPFHLPHPHFVWFSSGLFLSSPLFKFTSPPLHTIVVIHPPVVDPAVVSVPSLIDRNPPFIVNVTSFTYITLDLA